MSRILALAEKELLQIRRDHVLPRLIVLLPSLMLLLFGYAINFTLKNIPVAVLDAAQDRISETLLWELTKEGTFRLALQGPEPGGGGGRPGPGPRPGWAWSSPAGALERVRRGESVGLEIYVDGTDPNFAFQAQAALRKGHPGGERPHPGGPGPGRGKGASPFVPGASHPLQPGEQNRLVHDPGHPRPGPHRVHRSPHRLGHRAGGGKPHDGKPPGLPPAPPRGGAGEGAPLPPHRLWGGPSGAGPGALGLRGAGAGKPLPSSFWPCSSSSWAPWPPGSSSPPWPAPRCRRSSAPTPTLLPTIVLSGFVFPIEGMPRLLPGPFLPGARPLPH
jgi:hypothetical protein